MSFLMWKAKFVEGYCVCKTLEGFDDGHKLKRGAPVADRFPDDAVFRMDPEFPKDLQLGDVIRNDGGFLLVSRRVRQCVEDYQVENTEYLPVRIINHKGRIASEDYFLINPLQIVDAIDLDKSDIKWNNIRSDLISSVRKLVIDENRVPVNSKMFRLRYLPRRVILHEDLASAIDSAGFIGITFVPVDKFRGF